MKGGVPGCAHMQARARRVVDALCLPVRYHSLDWGRLLLAYTKLRWRLFPGAGLDSRAGVRECGVAGLTGDEFMVAMGLLGHAPSARGLDYVEYAGLGIVAI